MPTVTYNNRTLRIDDQPFLILSGSVHYIRVHPTRWTDLFRTFVDANLNTVETYVFWSSHEPKPDPGHRASLKLSRPSSGDYDFNGRRDLFGFITMAQQFGLRVILRLGPYVCAEVSYGGFPFRLRHVPDISFRTWNEPFMEEVAAWVRYLAGQLRALGCMAPQGGPVILVQLENEYSMISDEYSDDGNRYLQWMADLQNELDLGVPAIMCYGAAEGVVETINAFRAHEHLDDFRERHPDQPPVWTECWTGWYDVWGAPHHKRSATELAYSVARFFAAGGAGVNYYMWMGGTNWGRDGMYLQKSSYDYDAPIDEFYRPTVKAEHLGQLHKILKEQFVSALDSTNVIKTETGSSPTSVTIFEWPGSIAFYCNDSDRELLIPKTVEAEPQLPLKPRSVRVYDTRNAQLLFDSATLPNSQYPPQPVPAQSLNKGAWEWSVTNEPIPTTSTARKISLLSDEVRQLTTASAPIEQLQVTLDASDYCFYTAEYVVEQATRETELIALHAADFITAFVNKVAVAKTENIPWEDRFDNRWTSHKDGEPGYEQLLLAKVGAHEVGDRVDVTICVASLGLVKGDWQLGRRSGMQHERKGLLSDVTIGDCAWRRDSDWTVLPFTHGECASYTRGVFNHQQQRLPIGTPRWSKTMVRVERAKSWIIDLSQMEKGTFWVNGVLIGRYWNIEGIRRRNGFLHGSPIFQTAKGYPCQTDYHIPEWVVDSHSEDCLLTIVIYDELGRVPEERQSLLKVIK